MRVEFLKLLGGMRSNYWFIPAMMALGASLLSVFTVWVDRNFRTEIFAFLGWSNGTHADGARQMLGVIAGSMITVASTVFSITIAAVVYASGQYGPRLLKNFLSDRGNKITLGTFIATFLYAVLVLRTIRSPDESLSRVGFVPDFSVLIAVALAVASVAVLIFFLHHAPSNIRINHVIATIGKRILADIDRRFPAGIGDDAPRDASPAAAFERTPALCIRASRAGYLQIISGSTLIDAARRLDAVVHLRVRPGRFVNPEMRIADVHCAAVSDDEDAADDIREAFALGDGRDADQDVGFLFDELVEIALRALSPGINDPFTAITSMEWIAAALSMLGCQPGPSRERYDSHGALRVVAEGPSYGDFVEATFGALRQTSAVNTEAACGHLRAIAAAASGVSECPDRLALLHRAAERLHEAAKLALAGPDFERVRSEFEKFGRAVAERPPAMDAFA